MYSSWLVVILNSRQAGLDNGQLAVAMNRVVSRGARSTYAYNRTTDQSKGEAATQPARVNNVSPKPQLTMYSLTTMPQNTSGTAARMTAPLNTSDHLPITAVLQFQHSTVNPQGQSTQKRIDFSKVRNSTYLHCYQDGISAIVAPLICNSYNSSDEIDKEIIYAQRRFVLLP